MRKTKGLIIGFAAAIMTFSAASCMKEDNTLRYDNVTMGNIVEGVFVSDQGNKFNVTEQTCAGKLDTMGRAFIICDILKNTAAGEEKEYDVRVNYMTKVLTKNMALKSDIMETYPNDAIILEDFWISGGYINLCFSVPIKRNSKLKHEINLVYEPVENENGNSYKFYIRHNAFGEILKEDGSNENMVMARGYASFPISTVIKEDQARFTMEWNSYMTSGSLVSAQTRLLSVERVYKKSTYEHVPQAAVATASLEII